MKKILIASLFKRDEALFKRVVSVYGVESEAEFTEIVIAFDLLDEVNLHYEVYENATHFLSGAYALMGLGAEKEEALKYLSGTIKSNDITDEKILITDVREYYELTRQVQLIIFNAEILHKALGCHEDFLVLKNLLNYTKCNTLFFYTGCKKISSILMNYDGTATAGNSMTAFACIFPSIASAALASIISPQAFGKSKRKQERTLVMKMSGKYSNLGFIKLPFHSFYEFISHAVHVKADLIITGENCMSDLFKNRHLSPNSDLVQKMSVYFGV